MIIPQNAQGNGSRIIQKMDKMKRQICEPQPYHCCSEFHLAALPPICALIYSFAIRLSKKSKTFSASAKSVADFFGYDESTIRRGLKGLETLGFFEKRIQGTFNSSVYRVLDHDAWAYKYPNRCVTKLDCGWADDPLGQTLHVVSGMRVKWYKSQIDALRDSGLSDQQLANEFERYYAQEGQRKKPRNVPPGFIFHVRKSLKFHSPAVN